MMLRYHMPRLDILLRTMNHIGLENSGKNCAQVALNWILCKGVIPIPGTKTLPQAIENAQTPRWRMTAEQMNLLDTLSSGAREDSGDTSAESRQLPDNRKAEWRTNEPAN